MLKTETAFEEACIKLNDFRSKSNDTWIIAVATVERLPEFFRYIRTPIYNALS